MVVQTYTNKAFLRLFEKMANERLHKIFLPAYKKATSFKNKMVLDIGCGDGSLTKGFVSLGAKVIGVDNAKEWQKKWAGKNPTFQLMDARSLRFTQKFDIVTMNMVLLNVDSIKEIKTIFKQVRKVLKKGGTFIFSDLHPVAVMSKQLPDRTFSFSKNFSYWKDGSQFQAHAKLGKGQWIHFLNRHWTIETYTNLLDEEGFYLQKLIEPQRPYAMENAKKWKVPEFLLYVAQKK